jgi:hypothetical protein
MLETLLGLAGQPLCADVPKPGTSGAFRPTKPAPHCVQRGRQRALRSDMYQSSARLPARDRGQLIFKL